MAIRISTTSAGLRVNRGSESGNRHPIRRGRKTVPDTTRVERASEIYPRIRRLARSAYSGAVVDDPSELLAHVRSNPDEALRIASHGLTSESLRVLSLPA